jgi:hypothetical protein
MNQQHEEHKEIQQIATEAVKQIEAIGHEVQLHLKSVSSPFRSRIVKRFPVLFLLLVTFGMISTYLGMELMLLKYTFVREHPFLLFTTGVVTLIITGTLYKKLG